MVKRLHDKTPAELTEQERATIETLINYPNLERAFGGGASGAENIKQKMRQTVTELERIIRRSVQSEADKAVRIINAYQTTLKFLDELEQLRLQKRNKF